jgi:hypothetical protein
MHFNDHRDRMRFGELLDHERPTPAWEGQGRGVVGLFLHLM